MEFIYNLIDIQKFCEKSKYKTNEKKKKYKNIMDVNNGNMFFFFNESLINNNVFE